MLAADPVTTSHAPAALPSSMPAVLHTAYGVLTLGERPVPTPSAHEVLVRVHAAAVSIGDHHVITGKPYLVRLSPYGGLPRPRHIVPGQAFAGVVVQVGSSVSHVRVGDEVCGDAQNGAFAAYLSVAADKLGRKPKGLSFEEAACVPWAAAALQGLCDAGQIQAGQRVLIHGASGGVGTWAVQIARALGAQVTAVCSTRHVSLLYALGAHEVVDYTQRDFAEEPGRCDLLLDLVGNRSLADCRRALAERGTYVSCGGGGGNWLGPLPSLAKLAIANWFSRQRLTSFFSQARASDLTALAELVEAGQVKPVIERRYPLSEVNAALAHVGAGHAQGQTVLSLQT